MTNTTIINKKSAKTLAYSAMVLGAILAGGLATSHVKVSAMTSSSKTMQMAKSSLSMQLQKNLNATTTVTASELANATGTGPFTAGVNSTIPFEAFGGDGMLTRLMLKSSMNAKWSDNGTAKNAALAPVSGLMKGHYFYQVDLAGTKGATGQKLLDELKMNGMKTYTATVKVFAANSKGKADMKKVVTTKTVKVKVAGLLDKVSNMTTVSSKDLAAATGMGPFTAGVNSTIPFEAFGGDGMLTRLMLMGANKAPWSNNGTAKNAALPAVSGLMTGKYFYQVSLKDTKGATGQKLLDELKMNGTKTYAATVKLYGANSQGKADTHKTIAMKSVKVKVDVMKMAK